MDATTENETKGGGPTGSPLTKYLLHVPEGRELRCLPTAYESLEEAKGAFERARGVARWCLVAARESDRDEAPRFILRAIVDAESVKWKSLVQGGAAQAPPVHRPKVTLQEERMTRLLTPRLGYFTAEEVVRHVSARFQSADFADEKPLGELREFLRRGLLAYMDPSAAEELAARCTEVD